MKLFNSTLVEDERSSGFYSYPLNIPIEKPVDEGQLYWRGWQNKLIRVYFYLQQGLNVMNQFRYWIMVVISLWIAIKVEWPSLSIFILAIMMGALTFVSFIILIYIGRYNVNKVSKVTEWLSTYHGSHYGIRSYNIQKNQEDMLREIRDVLKEIKNNNIV